MCVVRTHNTHVQDVRESDVGGERAAAHHQRTVFEPGHGAADETHIAPCSAIVLHSSCPAHGSGSSYSPYLLSSAPAARSSACMACGVGGNSSMKNAHRGRAWVFTVATGDRQLSAPASPEDGRTATGDS